MKSVCCFFYVLIVLAISDNAFAQTGIQLNSNQSTEGYAFFETSRESYLIDNCGEVVNIWPSVRRTALHAKLMDDGNVIYIKDNRINVRDWDDNLISSTSYNGNNIVLVYEVIVMHNGNYLCLARENISDLEFESLGYNIAPGFDPGRVDMVVEIDPNTDTIVWQWNIKNHVIQQRDPNLPNYGLIRDNPRKLDMDAIATFDWEQGESFMINGFDYNEELDLIALSVRKLSEVIIIDHSTTTEEAMTDSGGRHGHGGAALFRWGNPQNYGQGDESDRELYFQHNPNWIEYGEHKGKIIMFNNGLSERSYSSVEIIDPTVDNQGFFILPTNSSFLLEEEPISINTTTFGPFFRSGYTSGAKVMPNGNIYVTVGQEARIFEMNPQGDIVWDYYIEGAGYIYRSEKYSKNFSGFEGRDLSASGTVENYPSTYPCELFTTSTQDIDISLEDIIIAQHDDKIEINSKKSKLFDYVLYNLQGQILSTGNNQSRYDVNKLNLTSGMYYIRSARDDSSSVHSVMIP